MDPLPARRDRDWEWTQLAERRLDVARGRTPYLLAGLVGISILYILVLWTRREPDSMALWAIGHAICAAVVGVSLQRTKEPDNRTGSGLPLATLLGAICLGVFWGVSFWLDGAASRSELAQWQGGAFLLLVTFAVFAALDGAVVIGRNILAPAWTLYGVSLFVYGSPLLGLATALLGLFGLVGSYFQRRVADQVLEMESASQRHAQAAQWEANHDQLTGVLNRSGLRDQLEDSHAPSSRFVLLVALDHFKTLNDRYGIGIGDSVLQEVAQRLSRLVDDHVPVARVSGDEFVIVIPGRTSEAATTLAHELVSRLADPIYRGDDELHLSATVGITQALGRPLDLGRALRESNNALRKARRVGRGSVLLFTRDMESDLTERLTMEAGLKRALLDNEIEVWGQPVINMHTGAVSYVEVVARWIRADGTRIPPSVFVPLAEELGLSADLTRRMLDGAARALTNFDDHLWLRNADVIVNTRAAHGDNEELLAIVASVVERYEIAPGRLSIGLKGTKAIDLDQAIPLFTGLHQLRVGFGIDDFEASYRSLAGLSTQHGGVVRLSKSLTRGALESDAQHGLMVSLFELGHDLGLDVMAEGIEDVQTARRLADAGIIHAQGFFFARAMPLDRLTSIATAQQIYDAMELLRSTEINSELGEQTVRAR